MKKDKILLKKSKKDIQIEELQLEISKLNKIIIQKDTEIELLKKST